MKKIFVVMAILILGAVQMSAAADSSILLKGNLSYGLLLSPDVPNYSAFTGYSKTSGGLAFNVQGLLGLSGSDQLKLGAELGLLSIYDVKYTAPTTAYTSAYTFESGLSAIDLLGVAQYNLSKDSEKFKPYAQAGLGFYDVSATATASYLGAVSASTLYVGMMLSAGAMYELSSQWSLDFGLKYYNIFITGGASTLNIYAGAAIKI